MLRQFLLFGFLIIGFESSFDEAELFNPYTILYILTKIDGRGAEPLMTVALSLQC